MIENCPESFECVWAEGLRILSNIDKMNIAAIFCFSLYYPTSLFFYNKYYLVDVIGVEYNFNIDSNICGFNHLDPNRVILIRFSPFWHQTLN